MATAVNPSARPQTTIRMGASQFTVTASRPPFPPATRDLNAEMREKHGPSVRDTNFRWARAFEDLLTRTAASICHAHGIGGSQGSKQASSKRTPRRDNRGTKPAPMAAAVPMSM